MSASAKISFQSSSLIIFFLPSFPPWALNRAWKSSLSSRPSPFTSMILKAVSISELWTSAFRSMHAEMKSWKSMTPSLFRSHPSRIYSQSRLLIFEYFSPRSANFILLRSSSLRHPVLSLSSLRNSFCSYSISSLEELSPETKQSTTF